MSYGPPPKTPYGDEDFIKEDWNPQQPSTGGTNYPPPARELNLTRPSGNSPPQRMQSPVYGGGQQPPTNYGSGPAQNQVMPRAMLEAAKSLTQEDIIFMRQWRQDSFYYRVCYAIGKWSYRDEFKRRLEASQSTTPYMQALRNIMRVKPIDAGDTFASEDIAYGDTTQYGDQPMSMSPSSISTSFDTNSTLPNNSQQDGTSTTTSYDELRARNRGITPR